MSEKLVEDLAAAFSEWTHVQMEFGAGGDLKEMIRRTLKGSGLPPPHLPEVAVKTGYPTTVGELKALLIELPDDMPLRADDGHEICSVIVGSEDGKLFISPGSGAHE